jgi:replication factor C subunit 3/5
MTGLYVDKYRPHKLESLTFHQGQAEELKRLASSGEFPHMLFYGPPGCGKKTRIMALLRELYGAGFDRTRIDHKAFKTPSNKTVEITTLSSNYHIELNPSDAGIYDRIVVQEMIKEVAQNNPLDPNQLHPFKVVVLSEVDHMTKEAQHALRRTMEKYSSTCRLILCCHAFGKVIAPVRSRCMPVRVAAPSPTEIKETIAYVCQKENINMPPVFADRLAASCDGNLRRALLLLESARTQSYPFSDNTFVPVMEWEKFIEHVAGKIVAEQTPQQVLSVRSDLYELISHCIPTEVIMRNLTFELMKKCGDDSLKFQVVQYAALYEHRIQTGSKAIFHIEAFVLKFMQLYKKFIVELSTQMAGSLDMLDDFE